MSYVHSAPGFAQQYRTSLLISSGIHLFILAALSSSLIVLPRSQPPQLAIEAVIVDETVTRKAREAEQRKAEAAAQKQREEQQRIERERKAAEQQRVAAEQKRAEETRKAAEQKAAEQKRITEQKAAEQKRIAEQKAAEAERKRIEAEQLAAQQRAAEERKKREAEARAEAERKRMLEQAEREERERREAEMRAAMEAEEALVAARSSGELAQYVTMIQQHVERRWTRPPTAQPGLECEVAVRQFPDGTVASVRTIRCNGDDAVRRSIEAAVQKASPLPLPDNKLLFERNLTFVFRPE